MKGDTEMVVRTLATLVCDPGINCAQAKEEGKDRPVAQGGEEGKIGRSPRAEKKGRYTPSPTCEI